MIAVVQNVLDCAVVWRLTKLSLTEALGDAKPWHNDPIPPAYVSALEAEQAAENALIAAIDAYESGRAGRLSERARAEIIAAGLSVAAYVAMHFPGENTWRGDVCGCPDDRCVGYHHGDGDDCGCLAALLANGGDWAKALTDPDPLAAIGGEQP